MFGQVQRGLKALGQALAQGIAGTPFDFLVFFRPNLDAVHHHVDVVFLGFLERGQVFHFHRLAIDAKAHIAQRLHLLKHFLEFAFFLTRNGREDHQLGVFGQGQYGVHHLAHGLRLQRQIVVRAIRRACAGIQQAQVIVDLGDRAHCGAWVVAGGFLLDADGGRQALDQVHIGFVHQLQKLPCIGRQAFDIAALAFGVERVKGQAGLA